jgi:hypothetical protein
MFEDRKILVVEDSKHDIEKIETLLSALVWSCVDRFPRNYFPSSLCRSVEPPHKRIFDTAPCQPGMSPWECDLGSTFLG